MRRWHQETHITERQWRDHRQIHVESNKLWKQKGDRIGVSAYVVDCECDEQKGRFRKKDAWDCGKPQCGLCHSDKFPKRQKSWKDKIADLSFREQVKEV